MATHNGQQVNVILIYARQSARHNWLLQSADIPERVVLLTRATIRDWGKFTTFQFAVLDAGDLSDFDTIPNNCKSLPRYPVIDRNWG